MKVERIELVKKEKWIVVAYHQNGALSHDFFNSKESAIDFVDSFYINGGRV